MADGRAFSVAHAGSTDLDLLAGFAAVSRGFATISLTIELRGLADSVALENLHGLLDDLIAVRNPIVIDLYEAECTTPALMQMLREFCARRGQQGLECRLQGLHSGVIPDPDAIDLQDLFVAYREARRSRDSTV